MPKSMMSFIAIVEFFLENRPQRVCPNFREEQRKSTPDPRRRYRKRCSNSALPKKWADPPQLARIIPTGHITRRWPKRTGPQFYLELLFPTRRGTIRRICCWSFNSMNWKVVFSPSLHDLIDTSYSAQKVKNCGFGDCQSLRCRSIGPESHSD